MDYQDQFYTVGTVTVTNGSAAVTGAGTGWETALIVGGVFYAGGGAYPIQSVSSETELTLAIPYVGVDAAGVGYAIDRQRAAAISNIAMNDRLAQIIREISIGNIEELNALDLIANRVLATNAAGNLSLEALGTLGRALLALAAGTNAHYVQGDGTLQAKAGLPVSTATQTALNSKLNTSGGTINGALAVNGGFAVKDNRLTNYADLNNAHQYSPGIYTSLGAGIWLAMVVEHNPGVAYQGIIQLGYPGGNRNWNFGTDGGFLAFGPITGTSKNFEIDHPVDPDNFDLRHAATEAPEMLIEYRGTVQLLNGRATVNVEQHYGVRPGTFDALWADAWVTSLQNQDGFDRLKPSRVTGATFEIICENETSSDLVSWVLMARRNDPYVRWDGCKFTDADGRLIIEFEKEAA
ncbi:hypothetical protein QYR01_20250 [Brucella anthropi]|uniref:hypothetical protein n=1 Tax=Brucella anthropi TaxID=529 RepID=UPI002672077D|nr:hypothetical protein [Brucella anthropi]WKT93776.1 hypothetical protein QYR01_20250 [Brucella anthropi]